MADASAAGLELRAGAMRLALRPDLGGCIAGLWHGVTSVLVSAEPATLGSAWPSGNFVLVPYSNRLGGCRFNWQGQAHEVALNNRRSVHAMHGVAWDRPWQVLAASDTEATLACRHAPDAGWPFAFEARQSLTLTPDGLQMRLQLRNTDSRQQPGGLGWHPYFPKRPGCRLLVSLARRWASDPDTELPTSRVAQAGFDDAVAQLDVDHCFEGWPGLARWQDEALAVTLRADLPYLVIFTPPDKPFFCVEPVSHVNNALNMADPLARGVCALAPGEAMEASFTLQVEPA